MLIVLLMAAQAPIAPTPVVAPGSVSTVRANSVAPNEICPGGTPDGIIVQGGLQPSAEAGIIVQGGKTAGAGIIVQGGKTAGAGIIVQGGKTADAGIIVQGGLQPSAPSESAAREKCEKPKR